jgi:hypothetical protein
MDIEGKHFPDEEDEHESKTGKKIGKIVFRVLAFCSMVVYIICFARIFSSCDSSLLEKITFSEKANQIYNNDPENFAVYKINTKDFMEYYGTIVLSDVYYAETAEEIEIGIKYNTKITSVDDSELSGSSLGEYPLVYTLVDGKGNKYQLSNRISVKKGSYKFERVAFSGLKIDFSRNYLNVSEEVSGEGTFFESEEGKNAEKYTLEIYNPVTKETKSFVIYDNQTSYKPYDFEPSK